MQGIRRASYRGIAGTVGARDRCNGPSPVPPELITLSRCPACAGVHLRPWATSGRYRLVRCGGCGFVFVNPRPSPASLHALYGATEAVDSLAATLAPTPSVTSPRRVQRALEMLAGVAMPVRFLDIGAGHGDDVLAALGAGCQVVAIEPNPASAAVLQARTGATPLSEPFETVDLPAAGFDIIMANQVLEHVFDPDDWMRRMARLLAPGGVLCVSLPNFNSLFRYLMGAADPFITPPYHLNFFSQRTLQALAARHGLAVSQAGYHTDIRSPTIDKRLPVPLRPLARLTAPALGRMLDRRGLGVTLTLYLQRADG